MKKYFEILKKHKIILYSLVFICALYYGINRFYIYQREKKINNLIAEKNNLIKQKDDLTKVITSLKKENETLGKGKISLKDILLFKTKILDLKNKAAFLKEISNFDRIILESIVSGNIDKNSSKLFRWTVNISVKGSYSQIKEYVDYLNKLPYLISINRLEMSKQSNRPNINAQITLEVLCR